VSVTQPSTLASMEYRVAIWFSKMPKNTKIFIWRPRWNMISPVIFAGALTIFAGAWGPAPVGPILVTGLDLQYFANRVPPCLLCDWLLHAFARGRQLCLSSVNLFLEAIIHCLTTSLRLIPCPLSSDYYPDFVYWHFSSLIFIERRYASAAFAMALRPSVSLSVTKDQKHIQRCTSVVQNGPVVKQSTL